jgi:hypothetical protein
MRVPRVAKTHQLEQLSRRGGIAKGLITAGFAVLVLAGCSGGSGSPEGQVASLPPTSAAPGSSTPTKQVQTTSGRPQMRLDDTPERRDALIAAWADCLVKHGARYSTAADAAVAAPAVGRGANGTQRTLHQPIPKAASAACQNKLPLGPPEQDPQLNPHYRDDWLANVKCLRDHGVKVHLTKDTSVDADGLTWTYDDDTGDLPANQTQIENDCTLKSFGGKN